MKARFSKQISSQNSTLHTPPQSTTSSTDCHPKRFSRKSSHSRSKSKEQSADSSTRHFFVKNICHKFTTNEHESHQLLTTIEQSKDPRRQKSKRADTPAKIIVNHQGQRRQKLNQKFEDNLEKEIESLKLQKELKDSRRETQHLREINQNLEEKLTEISLDLAENINRVIFLEDKVQYLQQKERQLTNKRGNKNLNKLKQQISQCQQQELSYESLDQKNREFKTDNIYLKEKLKTVENQLQELKQAQKSIINERELFLDELVQSLKVQISEKDHLMHKMRIQLNIFLVRQAKGNGKLQSLKSEELDQLKKKYTLILKKYHESSQELAAYKRQKEKLGSFLNASTHYRRSSIDSLSFSP